MDKTHLNQNEASPYRTSRGALLEIAKSTITQDRNETYGGPEDSFALIAEFWDSYLARRPTARAEITPGDVAAMMVLLKVARLCQSIDHIDSWIDIAGYAGCGGEVSDAVEMLLKEEGRSDVPSDSN